MTTAAPLSVEGTTAPRRTPAVEIVIPVYTEAAGLEASVLLFTPVASSSPTEATRLAEDGVCRGGMTGVHPHGATGSPSMRKPRRPGKVVSQ